MPEVQSLAARVARAAKAKNTAAEAEARRDLNAAKLEAAVVKALQNAPRPTDEQLHKVATILLLAGAQ
jgi:hypothetical protein